MGKGRRLEHVSIVYGTIHDKIKLLVIFKSIVYCINNCWMPTEKDQKQVHTWKSADAEVEESVLIQQQYNSPHTCGIKNGHYGNENGNIDRTNSANEGRSL
jgi:hypothetical protein